MVLLTSTELAYPPAYSATTQPRLKIQQTHRPLAGILKPLSLYIMHSFSLRLFTSEVSIPEEIKMPTIVFTSFFPGGGAAESQ